MSSSRSTPVALVAPAALLLALLACVETPPAGEEPPPRPVEEPEPITWALAIHGGAGVISRDPSDTKEEHRRSLEQALSLGRDLLAEGNAALRVVEQVVRFLEDDPKFNAGKGAVFTDEGTNELDAAIMDGRTLACGAVSGLKTVRNPVTLARLVMEKSPHVLLSGDGAERFAREAGAERVRRSYFYTQERYEQWVEEVRRQRRSGSAGYGTVGAVARDRYGNLAAATSTGGLTNKHFGRVGDVPIIGAGTYANNATAAISCTGKGEEFIRHAVAHEISAQMEHAGRSLLAAAEDVILQRLSQGDGGMIGVDAEGTTVMVFNSPGMYRGAADSSGRFEVAVWADASPDETAPAAEIDGPEPDL